MYSALKVRMFGSGPLVYHGQMYASMSGSKARYLEFCDRVPVPLHLQPWWLDAVCGAENWNAVVTGSPAIAVLPYFQTRFLGLPVIRQAPFSAYSGPWFDYPPALSHHQARKQQFEQRAATKLIRNLPKVFFFQQTFRPEITNWLPFYWAGFQQTTRYTYVLPPVTDLQQHFYKLKNTVRTELRRADAQLEVYTDEAPGQLFHLNKRSFLRKKQQHPYRWAVFEQLDMALRDRKQSICFFASRRGKKDNPCAGLYLAFDKQQASVLMTGLDERERDTGALHRLYWEAIRFCAEQNLILDFEGSMNPGIERVFRAYGGQLTPYSLVWRAAGPILTKWYRP